jgi:hypothetical protein
MFTRLGRRASGFWHRLIKFKELYVYFRSSTQIKDGEELPPSDRLMKFLVESTGDEKEKCANCDNVITYK